MAATPSPANYAAETEEAKDAVMDMYTRIGPLYALCILAGGLLLAFLSGMLCTYCCCVTVVVSSNDNAVKKGEKTDSCFLLASPYEQRVDSKNFM